MDCSLFWKMALVDLPFSIFRIFESHFLLYAWTARKNANVHFECGLGNCFKTWILILLSSSLGHYCGLSKQPSVVLIATEMQFKCLHAFLKCAATIPQQPYGWKRADRTAGRRRQIWTGCRRSSLRRIRSRSRVLPRPTSTRRQTTAADARSVNMAALHQPL